MWTPPHNQSASELNTEVLVSELVMDVFVELVADAPADTNAFDGVVKLSHELLSHELIPEPLSGKTYGTGASKDGTLYKDASLVLGMSVSSCLMLSRLLLTLSTSSVADTPADAAAEL